MDHPVRENCSILAAFLHLTPASSALRAQRYLTGFHRDMPNMTTCQGATKNLDPVGSSHGSSILWKGYSNVNDIESKKANLAHVGRSKCVTIPQSREWRNVALNIKPRTKYQSFKFCGLYPPDQLHVWKIECPQQCVCQTSFR